MAEGPLQALLDSDRLQEFFHVDERPERAPLRILCHPGNCDEGNLTAFGQPVVFVDAKDAADGPVFEVHSYKHDGETGTIEFAYPPEGLVGTAVATRDGGAWTVTSVDLTER